MTFRLSTPVLFLTFNRPTTTAAVFARLAAARPERLYFACDGARPSVVGEAERVEATRRLVLDGVDWPCTVETLLRDENLGCRQAVASAVDWFFEHEPEGIILEDDCLPAPTFFRYCQELLERYRDDRRVMCVSGDNFQRGIRRGRYSYYFSQLTHIWGWATWRRAWCHYHSAIESFEEITSEPSFRQFTHHERFNRLHYGNAVRTYRGDIDTWDYLWSFACLVNHGLTVLPNVNLVENIGFDGNATHTVDDVHAMATTARDMEFPLTHPPYMCIHREADEFSFRHVIGVRPRWLDALMFVPDKVRGLARRLARWRGRTGGR